MASSVLEYYISLMEMSYFGLVDFLKNRYGIGKDDYFKEESYNKFLEGKNKSITKGNFTRTNEGLYCHHVCEIKYENLSNNDFIKLQRPPHTVQKKENLIYCNLIEHTILHYLISKETNKRYGYKGLLIFLIPDIKEWYIEGIIPKAEWRRVIYNHSFMSKIDAMILITKIKEDLKM